MTNTPGVTSIPPEKSRLVLHEDWAVVLLGFIIIFIFLSGVEIQAPVYSWSNGGELGEKIFGSENLLRILMQFTIVLVFALVAAFLTHKPVKASLKVFPLKSNTSNPKELSAQTRSSPALDQHWKFFHVTRMVSLSA